MTDKMTTEDVADILAGLIRRVEEIRADLSNARSVLQGIRVDIRPSLTLCCYCEEPIEAGDRTCSTNFGAYQYHQNCLLRQVIGSVAHIKEKCSCFVEGSTESDPPNMTLRGAADAAAELFARSQNFFPRDRKKWDEVTDKFIKSGEGYAKKED